MSNKIVSQKMVTNGIKNNDWHRADIIAALRKRGATLSELSRQNGLNARTLNNALDRKWPKGEMIIAEFLDVTPSIIWPSRYGG